MPHQKQRRNFLVGTDDFLLARILKTAAVVKIVAGNIVDADIGVQLRHFLNKRHKHAAIRAIRRSGKQPVLRTADLFNRRHRLRRQLGRLIELLLFQFIFFGIKIQIFCISGHTLLLFCCIGFSCHAGQKRNKQIDDEVFK